MRFSKRIAVLSAILGINIGLAQEGPKPGPEHERLKKQAGAYDCVMKMGKDKVKCSSVIRMEFNGFHQVQEFTGMFGPAEFKGRGQTSYCPVRKKYLSSWIDSMSPAPMMMEGEYDADKKTYTEVGTSVNEQGKLQKIKATTTVQDDDNFTFVMYNVDSGKEEEMFTITYQRKK